MLLVAVFISSLYIFLPSIADSCCGARWFLWLFFFLLGKTWRLFTLCTLIHTFFRLSRCAACVCVFAHFFFFTWKVINFSLKSIRPHVRHFFSRLTHFCPKFTVLHLFLFLRCVFLTSSYSFPFSVRMAREREKERVFQIDNGVARLGPDIIIMQSSNRSGWSDKIEVDFFFSSIFLCFTSLHFALLPDGCLTVKLKRFRMHKNGGRQQFEIQQDWDQQLRWRWAQNSFFPLFCVSTSFDCRRQVFFSSSAGSLLLLFFIFYIPLLYMRMIWLGSERCVCGGS